MGEIPEDDADASAQRESAEAGGSGVDGETFSPVVDPGQVPTPSPLGGEAATGAGPVVPGAMGAGRRVDGPHIPRDPREDPGTVSNAGS